MKYITVQEQSYDEIYYTTWAVKDSDTELFFKLEKAGLIDHVIDVKDDYNKDGGKPVSFDKFLQRKVADIKRYIQQKNKYRAWVRRVEKHGYFSGASLGVSMDGSYNLKPGEKERWEATRGIYFIREVEALIDKLKESDSLADVIKYKSDAS